MEENRTKSDGRRTPSLPRAFRKQRQQIQQTVAARRKELDDLEVRLAEEMARLAAEASQAAGSAEHAASAENAAEAERLARLRDELAQLQNSITASQQQVAEQQRALTEQIEQQQNELQRRRQEIEDAEARLRDAQHANEQAEASGRLDIEQIAGEQQRLQQLEQAIAAQRDEFERRQAHLEAAEAQRRSEFQAEQNELLTSQMQLEQQQAELQLRASELESQRAQLEADRQPLEQRKSELNTLQAACEAQRAAIESQRAELQQQRDQLDQDSRRLADDNARTQNQRRHIARDLRAQREAQQKEHRRHGEELAQSHAARTAQLDAALAEARGELEQVRRQQAELAQRCSELTAAETRLSEDQRRHAQAKAEFEQHRQSLESERIKAADELAQLNHQRQQLADLEARTRDQRQLMARELRTQRNMRRQELERLKTQRVAATQQTSGSDSALAEVRLEREQLRQQLDDDRRLLQARTRELEAAVEASHRGKRDLDELHERCRRLESELAQAAADGQTLAAAQAELEQARERIAALEQAARDSGQSREAQLQAQELEQSAERLALLEQHQAELAHSRQELAKAEAALGDEQSRLVEAQASLEQQQLQLDELQAQCTSLVAELAEAQKSASLAAESSAGGMPANAELQEQVHNLEQRYQMAIDDLRAERAKVAELEKRSTHSGKPAPVGGGMDWEAQKRELLRRLSEDCDESDPQQKADKLKIEEVIQTTDRVITEKDRELEDLRRVLEEQSHNWGSMAVGAAAVSEILDKEEIIRQERENLQKLQDEWQAKLRQAEIDVSLERAKIARERMELEDRRREVNAQPKPEEGATEGSADKSKAAKGSRWLKHLGLSDKG